eukprot:2776318-Prymnesium_polylepis.1
MAAMKTSAAIATPTNVHASSNVHTNVLRGEGSGPATTSPSSHASMSSTNGWLNHAICCVIDVSSSRVPTTAPTSSPASRKQK